MSQTAPLLFSGRIRRGGSLPAPATLAQQRRIWRLAASLAGAGRAGHRPRHEQPHRQLSPAGF